MLRARGRIASERVADFSQVLRPRVAPRRRPTPSRHLRSGARVAPHCCICNRRVWASGACAGPRASRVSPQKTMKAEDASALRRLALPKLESAHSKIKTMKSKLAKPRAKRRSDQEATSLCSHGPFSIAVSRSAASVN